MASPVSLLGLAAELHLDRLGSLAEGFDAMAGALDSGARALVVRHPGDGFAEPSAEELYTLERFRLPTISWIAGDQTDAALAVALACDIRVASPTAVLRFTSPGRSSTSARRLHALLFDHQLEESLLAGHAATAGEAHNAGLVSALDPDPLALAYRIANTVASRAPFATQLAKEAIWRGLRLPLEQALRAETDLTMLLISTNDRTEGVAAFLEKRAPHFEGN